jgi:hypothetical protein
MLRPPPLTDHAVIATQFTDAADLDGADFPSLLGALPSANPTHGPNPIARIRETGFGSHPSALGAMRRSVGWKPSLTG